MFITPLVLQEAAGSLPEDFCTSCHIGSLGHSDTVMEGVVVVVCNTKIRLELTPPQHKAQVTFSQYPCLEEIQDLHMQDE